MLKIGTRPASSNSVNPFRFPGLNSLIIFGIYFVPIDSLNIEIINEKSYFLFLSFSADKIFNVLFIKSSFYFDLFPFILFK